MSSEVAGLLIGLLSLAAFFGYLGYVFGRADQHSWLRIHSLPTVISISGRVDPSDCG